MVSHSSASYHFQFLSSIFCLLTQFQLSLPPSLSLSLSLSLLLIMLEEVMTTDRNFLAHTLVRFYIAHGAVLPMLDCLVSREVKETSLSQCLHCLAYGLIHVYLPSAENPSLLFRGNSLASKCFDQFMKVTTCCTLITVLMLLVVCVRLWRCPIFTRLSSR